MEKINKIKGELSETIPNNAGIPNKSEDAKKIQKAHSRWKEAVADRQCEEYSSMSYWQMVRTNNML